MCTKLGALLEAADAASPPTALTFVIVVAASSSMRRGTAWHALTQTPYRRAMLEIPLQQHGYMGVWGLPPRSRPLYHPHRPQQPRQLIDPSSYLYDHHHVHRPPP